ILLRKDGQVFTNNDITYFNSLSDNAIFEPHVTSLDDINMMAFTYMTIYDYEIDMYSFFTTDTSYFAELNHSNFLITGDFPASSNQVLVSNYYNDMDIN